MIIGTSYARIAPVGSSLDDPSAWMDLGSAFVGLGYAAEEAAESLAGFGTQYTTSMSITMSNVSGSTARLLFGLSRKEYRIARGLEKKQILHKGRKPPRRK